MLILASMIYNTVMRIVVTDYNKYLWSMILWRSMLDAMIWSTKYTIVSYDFQTGSSPMFDFCSAEALLYDCVSSQYEAGSRFREK